MTLLGNRSGSGNRHHATAGACCALAGRRDGAAAPWRAALHARWGEPPREGAAVVALAPPRSAGVRRTVRRPHAAGPSGPGAPAPRRPVSHRRAPARRRGGLAARPVDRLPGPARPRGPHAPLWGAWASTAPPRAAAAPPQRGSAAHARSPGAPPRCRQRPGAQGSARERSVPTLPAPGAPRRARARAPPRAPRPTHTRPHRGTAPQRHPRLSPCCQLVSARGAPADACPAGRAASPGATPTAGGAGSQWRPGAPRRGTMLLT